MEPTNNFVAGYTGGLGMEYMLCRKLSSCAAEWEYIKFLAVKNTTSDEQLSRRSRLQVLIVRGASTASRFA